MSRSIREIAKEVEAILTTVGLNDLAAEVGVAVSENDNIRTVVLAPDGVDARDFATWLEHSIRVPVVLDRLQGSSSKINVAARLLTYFPASHLITSEEVTALREKLLTRTKGDYAVIIGASDLASAEDLFNAERVAWRLLVKDPPVNPDFADIREFRVFFWSEAPATPLLGERVRRDSVDIEQWVSKSVTATGCLLRHEILRIVQQGMEHLPQTAQSEHTAANNRFSMAGAALNKFKARILRRIENDRQILNDQIALIIRHWEGDAVLAIRQELDEKPIPIARLTEVVQSGLTQAFPRLQSLINSEIKAKARDQFEHAVSIADTVPWDAFQQEAQSTPLPEALLSKVVIKNSVIIHVRADVSYPPITESNGGAAFLKVGLPIGVATGLVTGAMSMPVVGAVTGVIMAAIGTALTAGQVSTKIASEQRTFATTVSRSFADCVIAQSSCEIGKITAEAISTATTALDEIKMAAPIEESPAEHLPERNVLENLNVINLELKKLLILDQN